MHIGILQFTFQIPHAASLKDKRAVITPILDGARRRHRVAVAEVGHQDRWQRSEPQNGGKNERADVAVEVAPGGGVDRRPRAAVPA